MSKAKRKNKKELVIQKRYWDQIKKRYPFLEEKTHWYTGTRLSKKEKEETPPILSAWSGDIPEGWVIRFGHELCEELRAEFIRCGCLYTAQILQAKEKYGDLRIYLGEVPENCKAEDIIDKYSSISSSVSEKRIQQYIKKRQKKAAERLSFPLLIAFMRRCLWLLPRIFASE